MVVLLLCSLSLTPPFPADQIQLPFPTTDHGYCKRFNHTVHHGASVLVLILDPILASSLTLSSSRLGQIQNVPLLFGSTALLHGWGKVFTDVPRTRVRYQLPGWGGVIVK